MRKAVSIILLAIILLGSLTTLVLYNIGGYVLDDVIDNALQTNVKDTNQDSSKDNTGQNSEKQPNNINEVTEKDQSENNTKQPSSDGFSQKQIKKIKEEVTAKDKISVSALVLSKLSTSDIEYLSGLMAGGLTKEEKAAAKKLCYQRFSKQDIATIYAYYKKYVNN